VPAEQKVTFCRICEANCGMVATVEDGRVTKLRPDPDHPLSQGYACPKGIAFPEVQEDPDRLLHPMRRRADGSFERVGWDEAIADIGARLRAVRDEHGGESIGMYMGNPAGWSFGHAVWGKGLVDALDSPHYYSAGSQDVNNRFAASALLYGSPMTVPIPDVLRTELLLIFGANPFVSNGSVLTIPRVRDRLREIVGRGGRVVVVDPRRTETAREFDHVPIRPDGDARLLLSLLSVVFEEDLADLPALKEQSRDAGALARLTRGFEPEATEARTGVPPERVRALARQIAGSRTAIYGRTGSCLGRHGTLTSFLLDALAAVTGNLDRPGGLVFGQSPLDHEGAAERGGLATYGARRSRIGGFPDVLGQMPATLMAPEIETPGPGQLRALIVTAGNPIQSVPDGPALGRAFDQLDLMVSIDIYPNDTSRFADYMLPATTWLERDDVPAAFQQFFYRPFIQYTEAVVPRRGEAREEWEIFDSIAAELGVTPASLSALRGLGKVGIRLSPRRMIDLMLRAGPRGDRFGLRRGGLSLARLERAPHGIALDEAWPTGVLRKRIRHRDRRVRLAPEEIAGEVGALAAEPQPAAGDGLPLRLIGLRELRSHNSWMHNVPALMRGGRVHALRMNPRDAQQRGLADGAPVRIRSRSGEVEVPVTLTDELTPGVVALPHGWGHRGGWRIANEAGGANSNLLMDAAPESLERLAGMSHLNGVPVEVEAAAPREPEPAAPQGARNLPSAAIGQRPLPKS
jgi:formate dehydrogenase